jgi:hypothetical protein
MFKHTLLMSTILTISMSYTIASDSDDDDWGPQPQHEITASIRQEEMATKAKAIFESNLKSAVSLGSKEDVERIITADGPDPRYLDPRGSLYRNAIYSAYLESAKQGKIEIFNYFESSLSVTDRNWAFVAATEGGQPVMMIYLLRKLTRPNEHFIQKAYNSVKNNPNSKGLIFLKHLKKNGTITFVEDTRLN